MMKMTKGLKALVWNRPNPVECGRRPDPELEKNESVLLELLLLLHPSKTHLDARWSFDCFPNIFDVL